MPCKNQHPRDTACVSVCACVCVCVFQFSGKTDNFDFFGPNCPNMDLGLEIQKTNVTIRISILEITCIPIFRQSERLRLFQPIFALKWI